MPPAVFLDRDNTLIHNDGDLGDPAEVRLIHGAAPAIASLCGLGNKIVAARLGISEHTVKTHVASIFQKLGADTRAEAVAIGARTGVIML